jgi:DNA ligase D-like protein (predicted 3'-phosphoesterase)
VRIVAAGKKLSTDKAKRDFTKTGEPSGETSIVATDRRRFVIQKHAATHLHYDLRLEFDGVFKSWAVTRGPSLDPADKRLAVEVEDHPLDYGDFEGTIPKGQYGGGTVQLWDRGYWEPEGDRTPDEAFASGDLKFVLDGKRLHGSWVLVRMKWDRSGGKRTNWLLIKHRDEFAQDGNGEAILAEDRSIASGRPMATIAAGKGVDRSRSCSQQTTLRMPSGIATRAWRRRRADMVNRRLGRSRLRPARLGSVPRRCLISSRRNCANRFLAHRPGPAGCTKSNSTATAFSCEFRTAR